MRFNNADFSYSTNLESRNSRSHAFCFLNWRRYEIRISPQLSAACKVRNMECNLELYYDFVVPLVKEAGSVRLSEKVVNLVCKCGVFFPAHRRSYRL